MESMTPQPPIFFKNPTVATILSFFWCGVGQMYNGQFLKGIILAGIYIVSIALMGAFIGFITTPILWIYGMVDANRSAKRINEQLARGASPV